MAFLTIVLKNLLHRPTRSLLTIAGIAVGIGAVVALASLAWGFAATWVRVYEARGTDLIVTRAGSLSPVPAAFARERIHDLETLPRVVQVSGMLSDLVSLEDSPIVLLFGWESHTFVWDHLRLVSGRWPTDDREPAIMLGTLAMEVLNKAVGSQIQIETTTFTICGVFESASLAENGAVVMTLPQLQRVTDQPGKVNFVNLKLAPGTTPEQLNEVRRAVASRMPGFTALTAGQVTNRNAAIQAVKAMSWATSTIALIVGAVGVMNTVLMSVFERIHEIGILLAVGWRRRRIVSMILLESIALALAGGVVGMAIGTVAVTLLERAPLLRGKIEGEFSVLLYGVALIISVGLGLIGGAYPALRAARMQPSDALRHE